MTEPAMPQPRRATSTRNARAALPSGVAPKGMGSRVVYENLRQRILDLELDPGSAIEEEQVVRTFGVSRTPVREALLRLWADGLVVLLPNRGARVAPLELSNLRQFYEALELSQRACTYWAALRATKPQIADIRREMLSFEAGARNRDGTAMAHSNMRFHNAIGIAAGNAYIAATYDRLLRE